MSASDQDRLLDLLSERVTEGLQEGSEFELQRMLVEEEDGLLESWESAAASYHVGVLELAGVDEEPLPATLRARLIAAAPASSRQEPPASLSVADARTGTGRSGRGLLLAAGAGWSLAAALLVAVLLRSDPPGASTESPPASDRRQELIAAAGTVRWEWQGKEAGYEGVQGDVVWNGERQQGYLRLRGLRPNRAERERYQLWIAEPGRKHPVDGGLFDVPGGEEEVLVPIRAALPVKQAAAFVITLEEPRGVVVSDGPHLVLAAP